MPRTKESRRVARFLPPTGNWKPVLGFEERYLVSDQGEVWSLWYSAVSPAQLLNSGYMRITLRGDDKTYTRLVHRLVGEVFCSDYAPELTINHKDGIKLNNCADNLEWVSYKENMRHSVDTGLRKDQNGTGNHAAKLTDADVREIRALLSQGRSQASLARQFKIATSSIFKIKHGQAWTCVK